MAHGIGSYYAQQPVLPVNPVAPGAGPLQRNVSGLGEEPSNTQKLLGVLVILALGYLLLRKKGS